MIARVSHNLRKLGMATVVAAAALLALSGCVGDSSKSVPKNSSANGGTGAIGGATRGSPLVLNLSFDSSVTSDPHSAQIQAAVNKAATAIAAQYHTGITVNIRVGWGEVYGSAISAGAVAQSMTFGHVGYSLTTARNALLAIPANANQTKAYQHLPASLPAGRSSLFLTIAQERALNEFAAHDSTLDGAIGFDSSQTFTFDNSGGVAVGSYDLEGAAEHELTEVLGRSSRVGDGTTFVSIYDLFRYSAVGVPTVLTTGSAYFSIDGGTTVLANFDNTGHGDYGDWASDALSANDCARSTGDKGVVDGFSSTDTIALSALGY